MENSKASTAQIQAYLDRIPGAVSGAKGHNQTFSVACALVNGFALPESEALEYLRYYNQKCDPPWNEKELIHKVQSAMGATHDKPRGHLIGPNAKPATPMHTLKRESKPKPIEREEAPKGIPLPSPIPNGARILIQKVFEPGEHVRIVVGEYDDDHENPKDRPTDSGNILPIEYWLNKLEEKGGDPNGIFRTTAALQPGIFIGLNPLSAKGIKDSDVTAFRHALIEFDDIPLEAQYELIVNSKIPCSAVIHSGGKSIHAWVKVNAIDRQEFDERVKILHDLFGAYGVDKQNRNPARLSRLPNCKRGNERQELLAMDIGAASFTEWQIEREVETSGKIYGTDDLMEFDPENDPNSLLGNRWICRGGSMLLVGQSGIGKSSFTMQSAVTLALGRPLFGIQPTGPMKQVIIQAENDLGDMAEMFRGVMTAMGIDEWDPRYEIVRKNLTFIEDFNHTGDKFIEAVRRIVDVYSPDLVWIDPLLSFIGDDISRQDVCAHFLREGLNPISKASGVAWMLAHHTNKPPSDPKAKSGWTDSDASYLGTGSAELTNWARAVATITEDKSGGIYKLTLAKRGGRAGARDLDLEPTKKVWMRHAETGIFWEQCGPPEPAIVVKKSKGTPGRTSAEDTFNLAGGLKIFVDKITEEGADYWTDAQMKTEIESFCGVKRTSGGVKIFPLLEPSLDHDEKLRKWTLKS